ncbi:MAG: GFA family protein [Steroidobacteraceae bacterium]
MTTARLAACSCGQLTAEVRGDPVRISICHCLACQRRTGGPFAEQARYPRDQVVLGGHSSEYVRVGDEGGRARFHFCPTCGATVWCVTEGKDDVIAIPVGAFADPTFPTPWVSVYESRKHGWVVPPPDAEHFP